MNQSNPNPQPNQLQQNKICPLLGVSPVSVAASLTGGIPSVNPGQNTGQKLTLHPCVMSQCALWDNSHNQCVMVTKSQNIEQLSDVIFKLVKKLGVQ